MRKFEVKTIRIVHDGKMTMLNHPSQFIQTISDLPTCLSYHVLPRFFEIKEWVDKYCTIHYGRQLTGVTSIHLFYIRTAEEQIELKP